MISRADRLEGKGSVEGRLMCNTVINTQGKYNVWIDHVNIKPETLQHSFDNGKTWFAEDEIHIALSRVY